MLPRDLMVKRMVQEQAEQTKIGKRLQMQARHDEEMHTAEQIRADAYNAFVRAGNEFAEAHAALKLLEHLHATERPDGDPPVAKTQEEVDAANAELSEAEVAAFKARHTDRWFAYWKDLPQGSEICTWTGTVLATVTWKGREYRMPAFGCFPSKRINFRARGIDGRMWSGTYYVSSGDYVRMRAMKGA